jgi:hypothetical protein
MSFPTNADVSVNCVPANCIPSPESPAKRTVTAATVVTGFFPLAGGDATGVFWGGSVVTLIDVPLMLSSTNTTGRDSRASRFFPGILAVDRLKTIRHRPDLCVDNFSDLGHLHHNFGLTTLAQSANMRS